MYKIQACLVFLADSNSMLETKGSYPGIRISKMGAQTAWCNWDVCFTWVVGVLTDLEGSFHDIVCVFTLFWKIHCHVKWLEGTLVVSKEESPAIGSQ